MPPTPVSPEEKKQRRLVATIMGLNITTLLVVLAGFWLGVSAFALKPNVRSVPVDEHALPGPSFEIFDEIYNLGEPGRYMKATMHLELDVRDLEPLQITEFQDEVRARMPQIRDLIISEISGKTYRSVSTPEGKEQLKEELRLRINAVLPAGRDLKEVIFTSFAVQ